MLKRILFILVAGLGISSCISTKSTIKNIDSSAIKPKIRENTYLLTEYADNKKYGYDQDYPINIGVIQENNEKTYIGYYFNGITGPNGEKLSYEKVETCCPFPTKFSKIGGGFLSVYEISWEGLSKPMKLYFNIYERGKIICPMGLSIKKTELKTQ